MADAGEAQDRFEQGRAARQSVPRSAHGDWQPAPDRRDPMEVIAAQDADRLPWLIPVRHQRMAESPFAFYRGAAAIMAMDLAPTPTMGATAQLCGDAHLANFGAFGSAERNLVFDVNDFDETLPGPFEWDVKRLATSFVLAADDNGFGDKVGRATAQEAVSGYRQAMSRFAASPVLDVWYAQLDVDSLRSALPSKAARKEFDRGVAKAKGNTSRRALGKLTETVDGSVRIRSEPPLLVPLRELAAHLDLDQVRTDLIASHRAYLETLRPDRRSILQQFDYVDFALKVVGVGSVGTRCWIALLRGRDHGEPLFLQIKEARESVLGPYLPPSQYDEPGRRVVEGQRMMQASGDVFLGWHRHPSGHSYYWRQFRDMKASANVATMNPEQLTNYATVCGWTLAHAHARSGDAIALHAYMGRSRTFDQAIAGFAVRYARQNDADYEAFRQAIVEGKIEAKEA